MQEEVKIEELQNILNSILDSSDMFEDNNKAISRDYISEDNISVIETNFSFFYDIPKDVIKRIFMDLLELIYEYEIGKYYKKIMKDHNDLLIKNKPVVRINKDLKTIKQYQDMIIRLYGLKHKNKSILLNAPKELSQIYFINIKLIDDLESEKFKIISKYKYYIPNPLKEKIKLFLKNIRIKYNLKNIQSTEKDLIDNLEPRKKIKTNKVQENKPL